MISIQRGGAFFIALVMCSTLFAQKAGFNYDESKVPQFELPALLVSADGTVVQSAEQWQTLRRPEVVSLFEQHVFGVAPQWHQPLRWRLRSDVECFDGKARRREFTIFLSDKSSQPLELLIYTPTAATAPVPCFLGYNFHGNHSLEDDPTLHLTTSWVRNDKGRDSRNNQANDKGRGKSSGRWDVARIVGRGYGLATIYYGDVDPDFDDEFRNGLHSLTEADRTDDQRAADAGGSIAAWAWGLSRVLDVLETDSLVDGKRVAVFGHSRLGKTSLWAGATDERFAMVISNNSGCGGAALSRRRFGETVARINTSFPHWFCRRHRDYNDNENAMPVDHHMLIALAAPRPVYVASAEGDRWADPRGEFLSLFHAGPVYELFGKSGLPDDSVATVDKPIHTDVGYHIRSGGHDVKPFDWVQYLNFADQHLKTR